MGLLDAPTVEAWAQALREIGRDLSDAARIDQIRALEVLKCTAEAAQAVLAADFDASQRAQRAERGIPAERQGRGVAEQVALARRESPHRGRQHLGLAKVLRDELPCTMAAFRAGRITEWRATLIARETACLSLADRLAVDQRIAGDPAQLEAMGDGELCSRVKEIAYELDAEAWVKRRARAEADRRVTCRPAPDVMTHVSALLPVKQGVAVYAALRAEADRLTAAGDPRGRGQIMADLLFQRVVSPTNEGTAQVGVTLDVVVSDRVLLGLEDGAAHVEGYGPIPGDLARELATDAELAVAIRRLYAPPGTGRLVAMDSKATSFPPALARFINLRDRICRTPWCDAPVRHRDHVESLDEGGLTTAGNGQGLCEQCNHAKQAAGWRARPRPGPRHTVETTTPTGHSYTSSTHRPPGPDAALRVGRAALVADFAIRSELRASLAVDSETVVARACARRQASWVGSRSRIGRGVEGVTASHLGGCGRARGRGRGRRVAGPPAGAGRRPGVRPLRRSDRAVRAGGRPRRPP